MIWIIRCANPRCRHVCDDRDWVLKPAPDFAGLTVHKCHCPKCGCTSYSKATAKEIAQLGAPSARMEAAVAAE
jgi:hypothetical protein